MTQIPFFLLRGNILPEFLRPIFVVVKNGFTVAVIRKGENDLKSHNFCTREDQL